MKKVAFLTIALVALVGCEEGTVTSPDAVALEAATVAVTQTPCVTGAVEVGVDVRPEATGTGNKAGDIVGNGRWLAVAILPDTENDPPLVNIEDVTLDDSDLSGVDPTSVEFWACGLFSNALDPVHNLSRPQAFASHLKYDPDTEELLYLVFHFDFDLSQGDDAVDEFAACLTGTTQGGLTFWGCETVGVR